MSCYEAIIRYQHRRSQDEFGEAERLQCPFIYVDGRLAGGLQRELIAPGQCTILLLLLEIYNTITLSGIPLHFAQ